MTALIGIHGLSKSFGTQTLFTQISFVISEGECVGLLGPNGSGKSTLLKILCGLEQPDEGHVSRRQGLCIGYVSQTPQFPHLPIEEILTKELPNVDETEALTRARTLLGKAQFSDFDQYADKLSGGWKKRLDIIRAFMRQPDLLLLDEPTNHLDLEGILWLEKFLAKERIPYVVVSHDRYFLENIANKMIELNRCYPQGLFISKGSMSTFLEHRETFLEGQAKHQRDLAAMVRSEVDWLRRSPKARTTKSQSRVQRAYELMDELADVKARNKVNKVDIDFSASERETRKLLVAKNLKKTLGETPLFRGIDLILSPGSRLGIVGKNGTGKTTLLKVLAGLISPDSGTVKYAEGLKIVYFDQHREQIPPHLTLREALSPTSDTVQYRGQLIHVNGWAKKFLFSPDRLELRVGCLSGGERARLQIAKFMLEPADILFLDEPTNDLDISTLEVIEDSLKEFAGAVAIISHDRCLMDRICTQILGLGYDTEHQFFADYEQWQLAYTTATSKKNGDAPQPEQNKPLFKEKPKRLSYKEQKELEGMEQTILGLEEEVSTLQKQLENPSLQNPHESYRLLAEAQDKLEAAYERWQFLSEQT